jgi:hypothetical protein
MKNTTPQKETFLDLLIGGKFTKKDIVPFLKYTAYFILLLCFYSLLS